MRNAKSSCTITFLMVLLLTVKTPQKWFLQLPFTMQFQDLYKLCVKVNSREISKETLGGGGTSL